MGAVAELAMLRGLRSAGYEPWAVTWNPSGPAARSRSACGVISAPSPSREPERLAQVVAECARRLQAAAVLPCVDAALIALSDAADRYPSGVIPGCASPAIVERVIQKLAVNDAARRAGLETPPTVRASADDVPDIEISYPAVVKPVRSEHRALDGTLHRVGVCRVADATGLRKALRQLPAEAFVQPYLQAPIRTLNGVVWGGELIATVHQMSERIWPLDCGVLSAAHTVAPDTELERRVARLLAELEWNGMFNLQFLEHDGRPLLMDLNPRPYQSLALASAAGVNLPAIWVDLLLGRSPRVPDYEFGVRWRYARDDLLALIAAARSGRWRFAARGLLPHPNTVDAVRSWRDPLPIVSVARQDLRRLWRRRRLPAVNGSPRHTAGWAETGVNGAGGTPPPWLQDRTPAAGIRAVDGPRRALR
jgi:predicted ATP-grasp superfamily ATP-dependent carboligase